MEIYVILLLNVFGWLLLQEKFFTIVLDFFFKFYSLHKKFVEKKLKNNQFLQKTRSKLQKPIKNLVILDLKRKYLVARQNKKSFKKFEFLGLFSKNLNFMTWLHN
jgi:hypothetical protein